VGSHYGISSNRPGDMIFAESFQDIESPSSSSGLYSLRATISACISWGACHENLPLSASEVEEGRSNLDNGAIEVSDCNSVRL